MKETLQKELRDMTNRYMTEPVNEIMKRAKNVKGDPEKEKIVRVVLYLAEGFAYANNEIIQAKPLEAMKEFDSILDYVKKLYDNKNRGV